MSNTDFTRKTEIVQIRCSPQQKLDLERKADNAGLTLSDYLRTLGLLAQLDVVIQQRLERPAFEAG